MLLLLFVLKKYFVIGFLSKKKGGDPSAGSPTDTL